MLTKLRAAILAVFMLYAGHVQAGSLFADLGGKSGIEKLVESATTIWVADPRIGSTFEDTNLVRFKRLLVEQLCQLTGGDCVYAGRSMQEAHKGLHLNTRQFNVVAEDLQVAMDRLTIPFAVQNRLLALLAPMHRDVVTR